MQTDTGIGKESTDTDNSIKQVVKIVKNSIVNKEVGDIDNIIQLPTATSVSVECEKEMAKEQKQYSSCHSSASIFSHKCLKKYYIYLYMLL